MAANALIRAEGNARTAMATMLVSVAGEHRSCAASALPGEDGGMRGAAIATVAGQRPQSALWIFLYFFRRRARCVSGDAFSGRRPRWSREIFLVDRRSSSVSARGASSWGS
jgi:Na+-driven multidrug efflux pump